MTITVTTNLADYTGSYCDILMSTISWCHQQCCMLHLVGTSRAQLQSGNGITSGNDEINNS